MALVVLVISPAQAAAPKLVGTVGPGYTITLTSGGKKATKVKAGKYTFVIADKASIHNFVLEQQSGRQMGEAADDRAVRRDEER